MNPVNLNAFTVFWDREYTSHFGGSYDEDGKVSTKDTESGEGAEF